jgi:hypothetical protein
VIRNALPVSMTLKMSSGQERRVLPYSSIRVLDVPTKEELVLQLKAPGFQLSQKLRLKGGS